jgi:hypothetical protein
MPRRAHQVELIVTANTQERRQALEDRLASLRLSSDMMSANRQMAVQQAVAALVGSASKKNRE